MREKADVDLAYQAMMMSEKVIEDWSDFTVVGTVMTSV